MISIGKALLVKRLWAYDIDADWYWMSRSIVRYLRSARRQPFEEPYDRGRFDSCFHTIEAPQIIEVTYNISSQRYWLMIPAGDERRCRFTCADTGDLFTHEFDDAADVSLTDFLELGAWISAVAWWWLSDMDWCRFRKILDQALAAVWRLSHLLFSLFILWADAFTDNMLIDMYFEAADADDYIYYHADFFFNFHCFRFMSSDVRFWCYIFKLILIFYYERCTCYAFAPRDVGAKWIDRATANEDTISPLNYAQWRCRGVLIYAVHFFKDDSHSMLILCSASIWLPRLALLSWWRTSAISS